MYSWVQLCIYAYCACVCVCVSMEAQRAAAGVDADAGETVSLGARVVAVPAGCWPHTAADSGNLTTVCILWLWASCWHTHMSITQEVMYRDDGDGCLIMAVIDSYGDEGVWRWWWWLSNNGCDRQLRRRTHFLLYATSRSCNELQAIKWQLV